MRWRTVFQLAWLVADPRDVSNLWRLEGWVRAGQMPSLSEYCGLSAYSNLTKPVSVGMFNRLATSKTTCSPNTPPSLLEVVAQNHTLQMRECKQAVDYLPLQPFILSLEISTLSDTRTSTRGRKSMVWFFSLRSSGISCETDAGEIWANMLHNVHAKLLEKYGFSAKARTNPSGKEGNIVWLHLFMDSFAIMPCNPTCKWIF